jgi:hypothetical protein
MKSTTYQRIVLIKLKEAAATESGRRAIAEETRRVFPTIPGVQSIDVMESGVGDRASWDLCLKVGFHRLEDVPAYRVHPIHVAYVDDFLKPQLECLKAWNFGPSIG